nr:unnamed protein product [Leishmania braziliensis]
MHVRSESPCEAPQEEIPLLIEDFSCANSFEEHVKAIEQYLADLLDREPLLQSFLVTPALAATGGDVPADEKNEADIESGAAASASSPVSSTTASSSPAPLLIDNDAASPPTASKVFGRTIPLYATAPLSLDGDSSIVVEVHVRDADHPITQQYCTPLFFLIRKVMVSASYRESETSYLLSLLSTGVRQALLQQKSRVNGGVLRLCPEPSRAAAPGCAPPSHRQPAATASLLPSPFFYPDGCAPCFAPAGDSYKQTFVGFAPPLPACAALPPMPASSPAISAAEWTLLHQRSFTTRFLADAFGRIPVHCQSLSDYIDLFQLHVGQHSRIRSDDFDGICVSLWKKYVLPLPWKFHPYGLSLDDSQATDSEGAPLSAASFALTWENVLRRENEYARLLCGGFTHDFGTPVPPLKHVQFHFQWNQLHDIETHEAAGRPSHLDPFQYALARAAPGTPSPTALFFSSVTAAQAAQRKCSITVQAVVRDDKDIQHGVSGHLAEVLAKGYLESLTSATAVRRTSAHDANNGRGGRGAVTHEAQQPEDGANDGDGTAEESERDTDERRGGRCSEAELRDMAARILEWPGATVTLQESLIQLFAAPLASEDDDDASAYGDGDPGARQPAEATLEALSSKRGEAVVARHLRSLWGEWEAHQQSCSSEASALHRQRREGGAEHQTDLRRSYFPDSFFARFAFVCVTQALPPTDVRTLWRRCLDSLHRLLSDAPHGQEEKSWQRLLNCLAMPPEDPPVDLRRPLLMQKLQLLRYAQAALLRPSGDNSSPTAPTMNTKAEEDRPDTSLATRPARHLITNGEVLCVPPPLPQPPTTTDEVMQRAIELNSLDAAAVESASIEWLQTDALYNDMCLFLHVNKAHEGRIVRFPDFVQWHSPRDFVASAGAESPTSPSLESSSPSLSDNYYLSERMQHQQGEGEISDGKGSAHVWWSLWRRAVPRSRDDIIQGLFQPLEQATKVLTWLAAIPTVELLLEVSNASIANALHRMLCHRCVLGDDGAHRPNGRGRPRDKAEWSSPKSSSTPEAPNHAIPATPRIRALHRYVRDKCTALTKDVEAASALFLSSRGAFGEGAAAQQSTAGSEAMITEVLRGLFANALHHLGEIEVSVCTAVGLQYLLGFSTDPEVTSTVHALSSPAAESQQHQATSLQMRAVTVSMATWSTAFAKQFVRAETREVQESMVRLTCMAERPLDTCACFQQLVVHQDTSRSLRLALALTEEVL